MWPRRQVRRLVCASLALQLVVRLTRATIAMENVDVELFKINSTVWPAQANQKLTSNSTSALKPLGPTDLVQASASAHGPPIYRSAPMQIDSIGSKSLAGQPKHSVDNPTALASPRGQQEMSPDDLNTAAGHHKKKKHKKKKKKVIIVKKKKRKKHHKKKKKKKKIIVVKKKKHHKKHHKKKKKKKKVIHYKPKHSHRVKQFYHAPAVHLHNHHELEELHHKPIYHEPHEPARHRHYAAAPTGKYFEYREVPQKGVYEFGFKRGNHKHSIERKEHKHKSHFKTIFNWKDKKGKGKHLFDYNHGEHHKHHYGAASQAAPKRLEAVVVWLNDKTAS